MTFISDQLEIKAVVDFQFGFCYFLKNKMNRVFNQFHEFFRNVTSKSRPDETLPFAQVDELNENNEIIIHSFVFLGQSWKFEVQDVIFQKRHTIFIA